MKYKKMLALLLITLTSTLTGCNIKFIEKAPEKESTEEESEYASIEVDPEDSEHMEITSKEKETSEIQEKPTKEETETTEESNLKDNQQEANGIIFNMKTEKMYVKTNTKLYSNAKLTGTASSGVSKGSEITMYGLSEDGKIAMVKTASSSIYYMPFEYLSKEKVEYETEEPSEEPSEETSESENSENKPNNSDKPDSPSSSESNLQERPPSSQTEQKPPEQTKPPRPQGGIPYPSNPGSTTIAFGVTFADEVFTAKVVASTTINTGPGKAVPSTGYEVLETLNAGDTVNCTGIGANGYVRVQLANGKVGFILNTDLKR